MPVHKAYFKLALPVILGMAVSLVYNLTDTWFIARTNDTLLVAGVSLCAPVFSLMVAIGDIFGLGGSTLISRLLGEKRGEDAGRVSSFCLYASILAGLFTTAVMLVFQNPILALLGAEGDTFRYAREYYLFLAAGSPAIILNIVPGNLLRTEGLSREAMYCTIAGAVINIALDPVLIFRAHMGAGGAALATVISNVIGDILSLLVMKKKAVYLSILPQNFRITGSEARAVFSIGIPASVTNLCQSLAVLMTNQYLLPYGTEQVAAYGIAMKVNMICMFIMIGGAFGAQPLLGYSYGAGNTSRLKALIRFDILMQMAVAAVFIAVSFGAAPSLIRLFMDDAAVIEAGTAILRAAMISLPAVGVILVCTTLFQAEGKAIPALVLSVSRQCVVLLPCLYVLSRAAGLTGIIYAQALSDVITLILALLFLAGTQKPKKKAAEN